ncbi:MAG: helix-turn-helix transcriptional regulator [Bacteroidaceae bacterium]|nr:helix-turn-helix transcriptional regulator [Bacteroidaceae bacterium]
MDANVSISAFLIGFSTAFFAIFSLHILFWRKERSRFQTILGCILGVWSVWNLKDIVIILPGMYVQPVLDWIMIIDGWSAITYTVFVFEVTMPGWTTLRRLLLLALPFAAFSVAYVLWPTETVKDAYVVFLWFYAWSVVIIGYIRARKYLIYVRGNYSNIDDIDISWLRPVFFFAIVSQLSWLFTSLYADLSVDALYYVSTIALWLLVLHYSWNFHPITIREETSPSQPNRQPIGAGELERVVESQQLYLNKGLTLSELAHVMGTNRTYVSHYLSNVRGQTFYDYINQLRIEKVSLPLMEEHPEYTLEYIAEASGFGSISTFRRAYVKQTGHLPSRAGRGK